MIEDLDNVYVRMLERLKQLRRERAEHDEILAFYKKVLTAQREAQKETTIPEIDLPEEQVNLRKDEGFSLIERENLPVDQNCAKQLFQRLCQLSIEENPVLAAAGRSLLEALDEEKLDFARLTSAVLRGDTKPIESAARELGTEFSILQTLVKLSLQPSLLSTALAVAQQADLDDWRYAYCPICGALPAIAGLVGEEGSRLAACSFCGHFWRLPRVGCPFCSNEEHEKLRYFYGEGEELCRVQVCDECRGYLKVMDTRERGDAMAISVDDIASAHLDLLAEQQGYHRKAPRVWGI
jgi:FdhE protein